MKNQNLVSFRLRIFGAAFKASAFNAEAAVPGSCTARWNKRETTCFDILRTNDVDVWEAPLTLFKSTELQYRNYPLLPLYEENAMVQYLENIQSILKPLAHYCDSSTQIIFTATYAHQEGESPRGQFFPKRLISLLGELGANFEICLTNASSS